MSKGIKRELRFFPKEVSNYDSKWLGVGYETICPDCGEVSWRGKADCQWDDREPIQSLSNFGKNQKIYCENCLQKFVKLTCLHPFQITPLFAYLRILGRKLSSCMTTKSFPAPNGKFATLIRAGDTSV